MTQTLESTSKTISEQLLIGGKWVNRDARLEVFNPAHPTELVGTIARGTAADVQSALNAAKAAQPAWEALGFVERANRLR